MVPYLKKGATDAGLEVPMAEFFDPQTADFSPIFSKVKDNGSQYLLIILSHAASDVFVKQWYDAKVPVADRRHRREEPGRGFLQTRRRQSHLRDLHQFRHCARR